MRRYSPSQSNKYSNRLVLTIAASLALLTVAYRLFWRLGLLIREGLLDFRVYYQAIHAFLAGTTPYIHDPAKIAFNYPPSAIWILLPFGYLSFSDAQTIFTLVSLVSFAASAMLLPSFFPAFSAPWKRILMIAVILQSFPATLTLALGQINGLLLLGIVGAFIASEKKRNILSGILWGVASMVKLQILPLGIYFLLERRFSTVAVGIAIVLLANGAFIAWRPELIDYFTRMLPALVQQTASANTVYDQSVRALFTRLGTPSGSMLANAVTAILFVAAIFSWYSSRSRTAALRLASFSLFLAISLIGSSFAWHHHLVFLFPGYVAAIVLIPRRKVLPALLVALSALLVLFHFHDPLHVPTSNPFLLSHALIGTLLLIFTLLGYTFLYEQNRRQ